MGRPKVERLQGGEPAFKILGTHIQNFRTLQKRLVGLFHHRHGPFALKGEEVARRMRVYDKACVNRATFNSNDKHQPTAVRFFFSGSSKLMVWAMAFAFTFLPRTSSLVPCLAQATSTRMMAMDFLVSLE